MKYLYPCLCVALASCNSRLAQDAAPSPASAPEAGAPAARPGLSAPAGRFSARANNYVLAPTLGAPGVPRAHREYAGTTAESPDPCAKSAIYIPAQYDPKVPAS